MTAQIGLSLKKPAKLIQRASVSNAEMPCREEDLELSIVMPCLNEAETLAACIRKARGYLSEHHIAGEVIVADNGSADGSQAITVGEGARLVQAGVRGYGSALQSGIMAARGRYVIMGDADSSYDFSSLDPFLEKLREGSDLVMGNRFRGGIKPGAMPHLHKYLGNPVLTGLGRLFFHSPCGDFHCGLRGFSKSAIARLDLCSAGMEFASEMVVKATLQGLSIVEVPTILYPDGRSRPPHLRSWRDGWRHLRFLLLFSPTWLFLYPGAFLITIGIVISLWLLPGPGAIGTITLDIQTLLYAAVAIVIGCQSITFGLLARLFGIREGLLPDDRRLDTLTRRCTLEAGLVVGVLLVASGLAGSVYGLCSWGRHGFGNLDPETTLRIAIPSVVALLLGFHIILSSFFLSILRLKQ